MTRGAIIFFFMWFLWSAACADQAGTTNQPVLSGNACAVYTESATCNADAACTWYGTGCDCPPNDPSCTCSAGACGTKDSGSGSGSGSGSTSAACACPSGGVCYEQIGGPATMDTSTSIECTTPAAGSGDPCGRIEGQGTCTASATVSGLCVCDNGIR